MMLLEIKTWKDAVKWLSEHESVSREQLEVIRMTFPEHHDELMDLLDRGLFQLTGPDAY